MVEGFGAEYFGISLTVVSWLHPLFNLGNSLKTSVADPAGKYWDSAKSLPYAKASARVLITKLAPPTLSGSCFAVLVLPSLLLCLIHRTV